MKLLRGVILRLRCSTYSRTYPLLVPTSTRSLRFPHHPKWDEEITTAHLGATLFILRALFDDSVNPEVVNKACIGNYFFWFNAKLEADEISK